MEQPAVEQVLAENVRLKEELEAVKAARRSGALGKTRRILVGVLVVVSCLMVVVGAVAWWTHETLLNTDKFVAMMAPVAEQPAVQEAVAVYATDAIFNGLDVNTRIKDALPSQLSILACPSPKPSTTSRSRACRPSPPVRPFQDLWVKGLTVAHTGFIRVIRDEAPNVAVVNGDVRLNMLPFIAQGLQTVAQGPPASSTSTST